MKRFLVVLCITLVFSCTFQKKIQDDKSVVVKRLNDIGLNRVSTEISLSSRNKIELLIDGKNKNQNKARSKIGGKPFISSDFSWPIVNDKHMSFLAQLNLKEIHKFDAENLLPDSGFLYFFYDADQIAWGFDPKDVNSWRVQYLDSDATQFNEKPFPFSLPEEAKFVECSLNYKKSESFPTLSSRAIEKLSLTAKERNLYEYFLQDFVSSTTSFNQVLGHPYEIQNEMQLECQLASNGLFCGDSSAYTDERSAELEKGAEDWILLFQLTSIEEANMMWGDSGCLYFWIRKDDLAKKDFSKVWMILQCY